jgi:ribosomal protein S18 acetylase RimI-like enzyme
LLTGVVTTTILPNAPPQFGGRFATMDIRPATPDDVPAVLPMVAKVCAFHQKLDPAKYGFRPHPERMYEGWMEGRATDPRSVFLVAEAAPGRLAGFLVGTVEREIPIYQLKEFGFVHDLWVEPKYRNEGTARQMVTLAVERFREIGVRQIRLDTAYANEPARKLFAACGFRPSIVEMLIELD